mmetsp:Transcript_12541/g.22172  ORF Transcript_12541/g.22172 Transcript_12541/m.22172 type:complete len:207 (+) Transcript_12541:181-801(+)
MLSEQLILLLLKSNGQLLLKSEGQAPVAQYCRWARMCPRCCVQPAMSKLPIGRSKRLDYHVCLQKISGWRSPEEETSFQCMQPVHHRIRASFISINRGQHPWFWRANPWPEITSAGVYAASAPQRQRTTVTADLRKLQWQTLGWLPTLVSWGSIWLHWQPPGWLVTLASPTGFAGLGSLWAAFLHWLQCSLGSMLSGHWQRWPMTG